MSGLLHRLAAQAMGLASPVRSAVRLPFAPLPPLVEAAPPGAAPDDPPGSAPAVALQSRERRAPVLHTEPPEPAERTAVKAREPRSRGSPELAPVVEPPPRIIAETPGRDGRPVPYPSAAMRPIRTPLAVSREAAPETEWLGTAEGSRPGLERVAADLSHPPSVESLLPPRPPRSANRSTDARGCAARAQTPGRSGPVEETTEVRVTIGRIEVTAVHEAPPPRRQAAKVDKPMTLDEYLAGRQGRRPY